MLSRRSFFAGLTAAAVPVPAWSALGHPVALSAARLADQSFALVGLAADGAIAFSLPLSARGHAGAVHPTRAEAVVIARRPGTFALIINCASKNVAHVLSTPEGRHFYGHGVFSTNGHYLFTTENEIATGEGRIGVWDRRLGYRRVDEFASGGIGPHEIIRLPDGHLAVANGGIRTHPETGREKLNPETMRPNLSIFTPTGTLMDQTPSNAPKNSLRHIAADASGRIAVGYQWQGDPFDAPPLIAIYEKGAFVDLATDLEDTRGLDAYVGSVAAQADSIFATSPRGGKIIAYQNDALRFSSNVPDVCGLASVPNCTLATDGHGSVFRVGALGLERLASHRLAFDNHLVAL